MQGNFAAGQLSSGTILIADEQVAIVIHIQRESRFCTHGGQHLHFTTNGEIAPPVARREIAGRSLAVGIPEVVQKSGSQAVFAIGLRGFEDGASGVCDAWRKALAWKIGVEADAQHDGIH